MPRSVTYDQFAALVQEHGLHARMCSQSHWQITGGQFIVNYYPRTRRGACMYVNGMSSGIVATVEKAIQAANNFAGPCKRKTERKTNRRYYTSVKRQLFASNPHCYNCGRELTWEIARLDHFIPLAQGGSDGRDNLRLACEGCDKNKGSKPPTRRNLEAVRMKSSGTAAPEQKVNGSANQQNTGGNAVAT